MARSKVAPGIDRLRCLFPHEGDFLVSVVEQVVGGFNDFLRDEHFRLEIIRSRQWVAQKGHAQNFYVGKFLFAKGNKHDLVAHNALRLCSSFRSPIVAASAHGRTDRIIYSVRKLVVATHRHLSECFNVQAPTFTQGTQPHFGFIGSNLAANIGRLNSNKLSEQFPHFQAKAMDLERLRENQERDLFDSSLQTFSLLALVVCPEELDIQRQNDREERLQETLDALREIARRRELEFVPSEEVSELSRTLIALEEHDSM
ncbi:MAG: hypothetical protein EOP06_27835 [Proteobacteria bacterium]|nr:MAG: hypothetical protein EOP06_27835 [Pseudomonadota bacterium]